MYELNDLAAMPRHIKKCTCRHLPTLRRHSIFTLSLVQLIHQSNVDCT